MQLYILRLVVSSEPIMLTLLSVCTSYPGKLTFYNSSRAYFPRLMTEYSPFNNKELVFAEIGVATARYSQHLLEVGQPKKFYLIEPYPTQELNNFLHIKRNSTEIKFMKGFSTDYHVINKIHMNSIHFIYLDGAHDYKNVKQELEPYWKRVRPGGILAGHDYCNYGEKPKNCIGCENVPQCGRYTTYGIKHGKKLPGRVSNQNGVVRAVHEWLIEKHPELKLYHTIENFNEFSLKQDGMDYDKVITNTRNPSWWIVKSLD